MLAQMRQTTNIKNVKRVTLVTMVVAVRCMLTRLWEWSSSLIRAATASSPVFSIEGLPPMLRLFFLKLY